MSKQPHRNPGEKEAAGEIADRLRAKLGDGPKPSIRWTPSCGAWIFRWRRRGAERLVVFCKVDGAHDAGRLMVHREVFPRGGYVVRAEVKGTADYILEHVWPGIWREWMASS